jgi:hypothetical protein
LKNKTKTYVLLIAVLVVWGLIVYKIINGLNPELPELKPQEITMAFSPKAIMQVDTFSIQKTNRDPFLGTLQTQSTIKSKNTSKNLKPKEEEPWPQVSYGGLIKRQNSKEEVFVVTINTVQHLVKKGQVIEEIILLKGDQKNITVRYKNKQKVIAIQ